MAGRFGGRESDKSGARDMAMDEGAADDKVVATYGDAQVVSFGHGEYGVYVKGIGIRELGDWTSVISFAKSQDQYLKRGGKGWYDIGKDEYRDEKFENAEIARGEEEDLRGRWGGRGSDKSGGRDMATDPPVSQAQRAAMHAAAEGKSTIGIPKSVGKEFANADPGGKLPAKV